MDTGIPVAPRERRELELDVMSDWKEISRVNDMMFDSLSSWGLSADSVYKYVMIVTELVENGLKYGCFMKPESRVVVAVKVMDGTFFALVKNPIGEETRAYLEELDRTIQWVRGFQDPFEAYLERMRQISREPVEFDKSGLGIARITYEGRAALDFFVDDNSTLNVSAISKISA